MTARIHWINAFRQCMAQGIAIHITTFDPPTCLFFVLIFLARFIPYSSPVSPSTVSQLHVYYGPNLPMFVGFALLRQHHLYLFHTLSKWFQQTGLMECHSKASHCGEVYALHGGTAVQLRLVDMSMSDKRRVHIEHNCVFEQRKSMEASCS